MTQFFTSYLGGVHGTAKSARDFLRALLACHGPVRVISPDREQFPSTLCSKKINTPEWFDMPRGLRFPLSLGKFHLYEIREWLRDKKAFQRLRQNRSNGLIIVNGWASCGHWQLVKEYFLGPKVIIIRESPRHFSGPDRDELLPDLLDVFSAFDHLIFVSERVCHEWRRYKELKCKPFSVLPNCCEEEEAVQYLTLDRPLLRQSLGFDADDFIVLCPGTIEHRKGQDLLLDVVPDLHSKIPNLKVLFVGDPATKWGEYVISSISADLLGRTVFHWHSRPGIMDLLHASDLLVFPSRAEAMPRTILEAMVMKAPVVASGVDGIPELVEDGTTGLLFSRDDKGGLLRAILHLYEKPDLGERMSELGSERYWTCFSRRQQIDRMSGVLESIKGNTTGSLQV